MKFLHAQLENGLTIIGEQNLNAQSLAVGYFVRTGSRDETPETSGVSHFLEHMTFKGTDRRSAEDVNREFDEMGAQYNAFTSEENTVYFGRVLHEFQTRLMDLLSDMMRPSLRQEDFEVEKKVILEEIARYKDMPFWVAYDEARRLFYGEHPLGNTVLGTTESITNLSRDGMLGYFERRYSPGNMLFALTGNFDWDAAVAQVSEATAGWKRFETPRELLPSRPTSEVKVLGDSKLTRAHLVWMMPGVSAQDDSRYVASVIADAVGDSVGSRFYWALVDPGLADEASLSHDEEDHAGVFAGYTSCDPERAQEIVNLTRSILVEVMDKGLREEEIERAKQKIASGYVLRSETPMGRLIPVGLSWVYRREYREMDASVDRLLAVDRAEVEAFLARRPFDSQTVLALGPMELLT